ncbi:hypothetical protein N781_16715 [Pontibacillus halophilus JSM 076056 = DSM 19796]|uniref:Permease n=1 Tax=Pontibacillus halophilus JSM 076056 = DSM 19796 TaxID=1385510 RepID=A0A0A5GGL8_9BACI|nr:hypothetical protein N781_16715 [Pontibacillus halophilus JSM 076056 = DSM 19796]
MQAVTYTSGYVLLIGLFFLFIASEWIVVEFLITIPDVWKNILTLMLSIFLEAIPFVLIGVFVSALIQTFVKEHHLNRYIPHHPLVALAPAIVIGAIFPVCECAIVPIVRRLIQKGMPLHVGMVIMVSAPVLNPIVYLSTFHAFRSTPFMALDRMILAFVGALIIGLLIYILIGNRNQLKDNLPHHHAHVHKGNRVRQTLNHAVDEFFDMGKFLIFGALLASTVQVLVSREDLIQFAGGTWTGPLSMMGVSYLLSLCSEADAFVASSFGGVATSSSLLAFLVYGPMIDLKNTLLMLASFRARFVFQFILIVTLVIYIVTMFYSGFQQGGI